MSIQLNNVTYTYMHKTPFERKALQNVSITIEEGEFVGIIGHTGSGKSTLVQHLNGLLKPTEGIVTVNGIDIHDKKNKDKALKAKRMVGMVFQYPEHQLFEETIYEDIAFGPKNLELPEKEIEKRVRNGMKFVGLDYDTYAKRSPFRLSGGQMRRVAIAGVIALEPKYLILDEPAAGLDPKGRDEIFEQIYNLHKKMGIAVVLVSHNMDDVAKMASRIIVMNKAQVAADDNPFNIFKEKSQIIRDAGLDLPPITNLMKFLKDKGLAVNTNILNVDDAVNDILKVLGGKKNAR